MGHEEPDPVAEHEHALEAVDLARGGESALEAQRGQHPQPEQAVGGDRVATRVRRASRSGSSWGIS